MKQLLWIVVAFVVGLFVLLLDSRYYHMWAYPAYIAGLCVLLLTLVVGREINGAKAWISFGSFNIQPVEFAKIATALALARLMSEYSFSISRINDIVKVGMLLCTPLLIIILQNDTGSGLVLGSFLFVLYREGLNQWLCILLLLVASLFISSFLLSPMTLLVVLILLSTFAEVMVSREVRSRIILVASLLLAAFLIMFLSGLLFDEGLSLYASLLIVALIAGVALAIYSIRNTLSHAFITIVLFIGSVFFLLSIDQVFNALEPHQQKRILSFMGIIYEPAGADYNVNQSKIAIGSGGLVGKGFLEGTQIKYGYVPERHTDFIFCTVGEEWGFLGTCTILVLFALLILRLMRMGERQEEPFGRIYCYCVASIMLFHVLVNVGMTVGLMPVMGIPLPFMSYGGSSLIAFTILLFIAIRLDASTRQFSIE